MKKKVLIPNRGVIALDIIDSLKSVGLETILMHSPEDAGTLPVKIADRSYKFYSSRLEDSYCDMEAILDKALELGVDYIHPGYGFLAENPEFAVLCKQNNIKFIGPEPEVLEITRDKIRLKEIAVTLGIETIKYAGPIKSAMETEKIPGNFPFPAILKPPKGSGGKGLKVVQQRKDLRDMVQEMLQREHNQKDGIFMEEYLPLGHHIEVPFFRDINGNILFLPEIESSIQRRFQKIFQESPSPNVGEDVRKTLYANAKKLVEHLKFVGLGYVEFIVHKDRALFLEINPSFQINALIPEIHLIANFIKKQFAIINGEALHGVVSRFVNGVEIVKPKHSVMLVSLMAENPFDNFQPSSGLVTDFYYYSTIRNIFKTHLHAGAKMSPLYDPYIGKIVTFSQNRQNTINDMSNFLSNITIKGVKTNLPFLRFLLNTECISKQETIIDFLKRKCDFANHKGAEEDTFIAGALLSAAFHIENRKNNYKAKLENMKQPGFFKRLLNRM